MLPTTAGISGGKRTSDVRCFPGEDLGQHPRDLPPSTARRSKRRAKRSGTRVSDDGNVRCKSALVFVFAYVCCIIEMLSSIVISGKEPFVADFVITCELLEDS